MYKQTLSLLLFYFICFTLVRGACLNRAKLKLCVSYPKRKLLGESNHLRLMHLYTVLVTWRKRKGSASSSRVSSYGTGTPSPVDAVVETAIAD